MIVPGKSIDGLNVRTSTVATATKLWGKPDECDRRAFAGEKTCTWTGTTNGRHSSIGFAYIAFKVATGDLVDETYNSISFLAQNGPMQKLARTKSGVTIGTQLSALATKLPASAQISNEGALLKQGNIRMAFAGFVGAPVVSAIELFRLR